jgi:hypothetical protein
VGEKRGQDSRSRRLPLTRDVSGGTSVPDLLIELADKHALSNLSERARLFKDRSARPHTVGLLGEQPAKARMLNSLVGAAILDPYTGLGQKRSVRSGGSDALAWGDGMVAERHGDESWQRLLRLADSQPAVEIIVSSDALAGLGAELVDIPPGAGSALTQGEWRSIELCHSLVLVIQAASMLTRHELELLYQVRYRCGPPLLGILIVGLEQVEEQERESVVRAVRRSSEKQLGELPVVSCPPGDSGARELTAMLGAVQRTAVALGARWLESAQLAALLGDALEQLEALTAADEPVAVHGDDTASDYLLDARLESLARASELTDTLRRELSAAAGNLVARLLAQVREAKDVGRWLNERLAAEVAEAVAATGSAARDRIAAVQEKSISWLEAAAKDRGIAWVRVDLPRPHDLAVVPAVEFVSYADPTAEQLNFFSRITTQVLDVAIPLLQLHFQVPIPDPDSLVKSVFDEAGRRHRLAEQSGVDAIIRRTVRLAFDELAEGLIALVRKFDSELIRQLKDNQQRLQSLRAAADRKSAPERDEIERSRAEIERALHSLRSQYVN